MSRNAWWILGGLFLVTVFAVQFRQIGRLKGDLATLRAEISAPADGEEAYPDSGNPPLKPISPEPSASIQTRLASLERSMDEMAKISQVLMEHGVMPPSEDRVTAMQQRFFDPDATEQERLQALRLMRRSNQLTDEVVLQGINLLQTSTNANFRRELLQHLQGSTNSALKQPLIAMLDTEVTDTRMREQIVNALRGFAGDPAVESKMWEIALNDTHQRVRDQAREALTRGPATPERVDQLHNRAADSDASLDERLIAYRALRLAKSHTPELTSELVNLAQSTSDPVDRAKLFKAFNGLTDEFLMPPLVNGLQDPDPVVRQNAADALSSFPDPRVQDWLRHLIETDTDPGVKREAHAALEHSQRVSRRGQ